MLASLSNDQKQLLRRLVSKKRKGELQEPFRLGTGARGKPVPIDHPDIEFEHSDYLALVDAGLLKEREKAYRIASEGYQAVTKNFSDVDPIALEPAQEALLIKLVEASRNQTPARRRSFSTMSGDDKVMVHHPGLPTGEVVHPGDITILAQEGLLAITGQTNAGVLFDITPSGIEYYSYLKGLIGGAVSRSEESVRSYLDAELFQEKHPVAYQRWAAAEEMLWGGDARQQLTDIGHRCREALQEFVAGLVKEYQPPDVDSDKAHTRNRLSAVLEVSGERHGSTVPKAIKDFYEVVNTLIQRQEHGAVKEGEPLVWDDARRVVFMTALFMFETEKMLAR